MSRKALGVFFYDGRNIVVDENASVTDLLTVIEYLGKRLHDTRPAMGRAQDGMRHFMPERLDQL